MIPSLSKSPPQSLFSTAEKNLTPKTADPCIDDQTYRGMLAAHKAHVEDEAEERRKAEETYAATGDLTVFKKYFMTRESDAVGADLVESTWQWNIDVQRWFIKDDSTGFVLWAPEQKLTGAGCTMREM
jgi:hypothetical protein